MSLMHAAALIELEAGRHKHKPDHKTRNHEKLEMIDADAIHHESLIFFGACGAKIELCYHWIQRLMIRNIANGVINVPPPIVSRAFQELSNGVVKFHDASKIAEIPFPFPYAQTTLVLLSTHWVMTPFVMCTWTDRIALAGFYSFVTIFILWSLYAIARELEDPFGNDDNDLDAEEMQHAMNTRLALLLNEACEIPETHPDIHCQHSSTMLMRRMTSM